MAGMWFTNNEPSKKQRLPQSPKPAGSFSSKATNHGGVGSVKQSPGVYPSLRKPKT